MSAREIMSKGKLKLEIRRFLADGLPESNF